MNLDFSLHPYHDPTTSSRVPLVIIFSKSEHERHRGGRGHGGSTWTVIWKENKEQRKRDEERGQPIPKAHVGGGGTVIQSSHHVGGSDSFPKVQCHLNATTARCPLCGASFGEGGHHGPKQLVGVGLQALPLGLQLQQRAHSLHGQVVLVV